MFALGWRGDSVLLDSRGHCKAESSTIWQTTAQSHRQPVGSALDVYHPEFATPEETRTGQHTGDSVVRGLACFCLSSHPCTHPCLSLGIRWAIVLEEGPNTEDCSRSRGPGMLWELKMELITARQCLLLLFRLSFLWEVAVSELPLGVTAEEQTNQDILREENFSFPVCPGFL